MMQGLFVAPFNSEEKSVTRSSWRNVVGFVFPFLSPSNHQAMMGKMNSNSVRLIFSQLTWPDGKYAPANEALNFSVKHLPLLKVDVDLEHHSVWRWKRLPNEIFGDECHASVLTDAKKRRLIS